ncbi:hypothetical protein BC830DRAFT_1162696 [Chytriomyces sp. MP71]|nr:hypothetical protein BC830DRAFT_1162696 [Chytriomyces sp. MP71]
MPSLLDFVTITSRRRNLLLVGSKLSSDAQTAWKAHEMVEDLLQGLTHVDGEWMLDSMMHPLRVSLGIVASGSASAPGSYAGSDADGADSTQLGVGVGVGAGSLTGTSLVSGASSGEATTLLLRVLDALFHNVFAKQDEALSLDIATQAALAVRHAFASPLVVAHFKAVEAWDVLEKWGSLTPRFNIGMALVQLALHIGLDDSNNEWEMVLQMDAVYDEAARKGVFAILDTDTPVAVAIDMNAPPQHRRRALQSCLAVLKTSNSRNNKITVSETNTIHEFAAIAVELAASKSFSFMADLFVDIVQEIHSLMEAQSGALDCSWMAPCFIALTQRFKPSVSDFSILDTTLGPIILVTMIQDITKFTPSSDFEIFDALFTVFTFMDESAIQYVASCFSTSSEGAVKAAVKHLGPLLQLSKAGNQHVDMILVQLMSTNEKVAFKPCLDELFDMPTPSILISFVFAFRDETSLFIDRVSTLLPLLTNEQIANTVSTIVMDVIARNPTSFSNAFALDPITNSLKSPECKVKSSGPVNDCILSIWGVLATSSDEGCYLCTPLLIETIPAILKVPEDDRSPETMKILVSLLQTVLTVAKWHPELIAPYEGIFEQVVMDSMAVDESGAPLLDVVEQIVDSLQEFGGVYSNTCAAPRRILTARRQFADPAASRSSVSDTVPAIRSQMGGSISRPLMNPTGFVFNGSVITAGSNYVQSFVTTFPRQTPYNHIQTNPHHQQVLYHQLEQTQPQEVLSSSASNVEDQPYPPPRSRSAVLSAHTNAGDTVERAGRENNQWLTTRLENLELTVEDLKRETAGQKEVIETQAEQILKMQKLLETHDIIILEQQKRILEYNAHLTEVEHRQEREATVKPKRSLKAKSMFNLKGFSEK